MKHQQKYVYPFLLLLIVSACLQRNEQDTGTVFNLESFIDSQVGSLARINPELVKHTGIGAGAESLSLTPDSSGWQKELSIFRTADIHKPGLRNFYTRHVRQSGGTEIEEYILSDTAQSETLSLRIIWEKNTGLVRSVAAEQHTDNPIYHSRRELFMFFQEDENQSVLLDSFSVKGYQKMILQDSVNYFTAGKIVLP